MKKNGWPMVRLTMVMESYGAQRLVKIAAEVTGYLVKGADGRPVVQPLPATSGDTEARAAQARTAAILGRLVANG